MVQPNDRYHRQSLIRGWKQERLEKASVAILGSDNVAQMAALSLVSLGVGGVFLYDSASYGKRREGLLRLSPTQDSAVEALESLLSRCNSHVRVAGIHAPLHSPLLLSLLGAPDIIVDATQDVAVRKNSLAYASEKKIPYLSAAANETRAEISVYLPEEKAREAVSLLDMETYGDRKQGMLVSEVIGGVIAEEVRKILMPLGDEIPVQHLSYSRVAPSRFHAHNEEEIRIASLAEKHAFIIGAGALGNFAGIGLTLAGVGNITILDFDSIESTNLNRQPLFFDAVGEYKSKTLAERLQRLNGIIRVQGLVGKLDEQCDGIFKKSKPDAIFDCVDNLATRALANYYAVRYRIPLVSGGTSYAAGQVAVYVPGQSMCLQCKLDVERALAQASRRQRCVLEPEPSVVTTNQVIGACMAVEGCAVLHPKAYGEPLRKTLKYDSRAPQRAALYGTENACGCAYPGIRAWFDNVMERYKEEKRDYGEQH